MPNLIRVWLQEAGPETGTGAERGACFFSSKCALSALIDAAILAALTFLPAG